MPHNFLPIGKRWVNLDQVTSVDLSQDSMHPGVPVQAVVNYTSGKSLTFQHLTEVKELVEFLTAHRPT